MYNIAILDDEIGIIDSVSVVLKRSGYKYTGYTNQKEAIESIIHGDFDLLILDYMMDGMHGNEVVEEIRKFNKELYILLLTGHKDIAPPIETLKQLDIQGYCEKSDKFDQLILLIESALKSISQLSTIKKYKDSLDRILNVIPQIYQLQPVANILEKILTGIIPIVNSENAFILIDNINNTSNGGNKSIFRGIGKFNVDIDIFMSMLNPILIENIGYSRSTGKNYVFHENYILPLSDEQNKVIGVMYVETNRFGEGEKLLEIYKRQAAASISNAFLHSLVNMKNEELNKTYDDLKSRYIDVIEALRLAVDAKDARTLGHSDRVAHYSVIIGEALGLSTSEIASLRLGGIFHDIGKIGTSDSILFKPSKLNDIEYEEIKLHTIKGANILSAVSMFKEIVPTVKCHHEWIDGSGYPCGLKGNEIPLHARIVSIAEAFDDMITEKTFKTKLTLEEAQAELELASGTQFDTNVLEVFLKIIEENPAILKIK